MDRRTLVALLVCVTAAALPACGGDEPTADSQGGSAVAPPPPANSEAAITDTVRAYFNALAAGDGKRVCEQMSSTAQVEAVEGGQDFGAKTCEEAVAGASGAVDAENKRELLNTDVTDIAINGDSASASAVGGRREIWLALNDGKWQILSVVNTSGGR